MKLLSIMNSDIINVTKKILLKNILERCSDYMVYSHSKSNNYYTGFNSYDEFRNVQENYLNNCSIEMINFLDTSYKMLEYNNMKHIDSNYYVMNPIVGICVDKNDDIVYCTLTENDD